MLLDVGKHMSNGILQSTYNDMSSCQNGCEIDEMCSSIDFYHSTRQCWFHTATTSCNSNLLSLEGSIHLQIKDCTRTY